MTTPTFAGTGFGDESVLVDVDPPAAPPRTGLGVELRDLRGTDYQVYLDALVGPHRVRIRVAVLNLDGDYLSALDPTAVDGQVDVVQGGEASRSLTLTLFDPDHELHMDSDSPTEGSLYRDRMLKVTYGVWVEALDEWVEYPVFVGPLVKWDRTADEVSVEAHSMELLAQRGAKVSSRAGRKARKDSAIRKLMADRTGETRFDLGPCNTRLHRPVSLRAVDPTWPAVQRIAQSADRQLFYSADGVLRLRKPPDNASFTFTDAHLLSPVTVSDVPENVVNRVSVVGKRPRPSRHREDGSTKRGGGGKPRGRAELGRRHPLSAYRLGRVGAPSFIDFEESNDHVRSDREANRMANRILQTKSDQVRAVSFDSLPVPFLEPGDMVRVRSDATGFELKFRLREFSLPLFVGDAAPMSVGARRKVSGRRRRAGL